MPRFLDLLRAYPAIKVRLTYTAVEIRIPDRLFLTLDQGELRHLSASILPAAQHYYLGQPARRQFSYYDVITASQVVGFTLPPPSR